jgi:hypothetical protein
MLDDDTRKAAQDDLDAAQDVDATARAVDVAHPNGDALDDARVLPELFTESSSDMCPVVFIERDAVDSDIRRCSAGRGSTGNSLRGPGDLIRERFSLSHASFSGGRCAVHDCPSALQQARRCGLSSTGSLACEVWGIVVSLWSPVALVAVVVVRLGHDVRVRAADVAVRTCLRTSVGIRSPFAIDQGAAAVTDLNAGRNHTDRADRRDQPSCATDGSACEPSGRYEQHHAGQDEEPLRGLLMTVQRTTRHDFLDAILL